MADHDWKKTAGHAVHTALHTPIGKQAANAVVGTVVTTATAVLGPAAVVVAAPVALAGLIGYGIWSLFNK